MKSIEERAEAFAEKIYSNGEEWWKDDASIIALGESCYIRGAKDQHQIDVDKACEWFEHLLRVRWGFVAYSESLVSQLKKAMEE